MTVTLQSLIVSIHKNNWECSLFDIKKRGNEYIQLEFFINFVKYYSLCNARG